MTRPTGIPLFIVLCGLLAFDALVLGATKPISEDRDLLEIDLSTWKCLDRLGGTARAPDTVERNQLKNRSAIELKDVKVLALDWSEFMRHVAASNAETSGKRRRNVTEEEKEEIDALEKQIVSLTGYLVLAYAGPPESTNCSATDFHDWHLEIFNKPLDHPPQPGDPTPIICEITPRTQNELYRAGVRIQELAAFFRRPDVTYESTGHAAQKIRLTGYLLWDDEHNSPKDVGMLISSVARNRYHNPWRATAWEIHPVMKIERVTAGEPASSSAPFSSAAGTPTPAATPQRIVTILRQTKIRVPYGETVLPRGMRLPIVSRDEETVTIEYLGGKYAIPIESTDLRLDAPPPP